MRRKMSRTNNSDEATIDMTSMLDVVFIMLIFFIVTTSFVKEAGIDVNRPTAASSDNKEKAYYNWGESQYALMCDHDKETFEMKEKI